jgi:hypothetical protein
MNKVINNFAIADKQTSPYKMVSFYPAICTLKYLKKLATQGFYIQHILLVVLLHETFRHINTLNCFMSSKRIFTMEMLVIHCTATMAFLSLLLMWTTTTELEILQKEAVLDYTR